MMGAGRSTCGGSRMGWRVVFSGQLRIQLVKRGVEISVSENSGLRCNEKEGEVDFCLMTHADQSTFANGKKRV